MNKSDVIAECICLLKDTNIIEPIGPNAQPEDIKAYHDKLSVYEYVLDVLGDRLCDEIRKEVLYDE